jgi:hypothetical protein
LRRYFCGLRTWTLAVVVAGCATAVSGAQSPADFYGAYIKSGSGKKPADKIAIVISEAGSQIEVKRMWNGKAQVSTFPLDGSPGVYRTESGAAGQGTVHWKGLTMMIETLVTSPPQAGKTIRFHTKEQWQLSKDRQTLKIHVETDSPDMPREIMSVAIEPYTELYQRSTTP